MTLADILMAGKSWEKGISSADVDMEQLKIGTEVEMEHTSDESIAHKIALDHLAEYPDYYVGLDFLESIMSAEILGDVMLLVQKEWS
jgi:hypothetical protein